jgi:murein DD-endopeptidase MepM/ murein hydrolase activator NlpD
MSIQLKQIILTADETVLNWKTLPEKLAIIENSVNKGKNIEYSIKVKYKAAVPSITKEGRIDHNWLLGHINEEFKNGADIIAFHFSEKQKKIWGIQDTLRGSNPNSKQEVGDFWFSSDELSLRNGYNRFVEVFLHELSHEKSQQDGSPDITHEWHSEHGTIEGIFATFDWNLYQPKRMKLQKKKNLLERIVELYKRKLALLTTTHTMNPLFDKTIQLSQPYGLANSEWYKLTGHHIGTDWATPVGTPIYAPADCEVTRVGFLKDSLGHWCEVKIDKWYMILCHLNHTADSGKQKKGDLIGYTGNTGFTKGVHCHVEAWHQPMDRSKLSKATWDNLTFDVTTKFK